MQSWLDKFVALIGTLVFHAFVVVLLVVGMRLPASTPPPPVLTTIKARVVSDEAFRNADLGEQTISGVDKQVEDARELERLERIEKEREALKVERALEVERQQRSAQEQLQQQQAEAAAKTQADLAAQQQARREAEAIVKAQALADQAKREREQAEQTEAARLAEQQAQREAQAAADKKAREEAQRKAREEEQRRARAEAARQAELESQLRDAMEAEEARAGAINQGLLAQYMETIRQKVQRNWIRPAGVPDGVSCEVAVRQLSSGEVASVRVLQCAGGEALIRSIETAVRKASPLPPPPDASLFDPNLRFPFRTGE